MSRSLPVELLRLVVDHLRLHDFIDSRALEKETSKTLRSLCLTSRTFRQIAQPLLFRFARPSNLFGVNELGILVENNRDGENLKWVRKVVFDEGRGRDVGNRFSYALVDTFTKAATCLEQLVVKADSFRLMSFNGTNLRQLFLGDVVIPSNSLADLALPALDLLVVYESCIDSGFLQRSSFPALRHLAWDVSSSLLWEADPARLVDFGIQLDSILLLADVFDKHRISLPPFLASRTLVDCPIDFSDSLESSQDSIVHLRVGMSAQFELLAELASSPGKFARLETLYLPLPSSISASPSPDDISVAFTRVVAACKERDIEVVFEEQSPELRLETFLSEEFMKRMTARRLSKEGAV